MQSFVLLIWLTLCAAQDARERHIANRLTLGVGALALAYLLWSGTTWIGAPAEHWRFLCPALGCADWAPGTSNS